MHQFLANCLIAYLCCFRNVCPPKKNDVQENVFSDDNGFAESNSNIDNNGTGKDVESRPNKR